LKFFVSTCKEFLEVLFCGLSIFTLAFCFCALIVIPFVVSMYVDSLVEGHLGVHWILLIMMSTFFIEFAVIRVIEGDDY